MKRTTDTTYFYKEKDGSDDAVLERTVIHETVDGYDYNDCDGCEDGELVAGEVEVVDAGAAIAVAALTLATVSLCLTAVSAIFRRK